MSSISKLPSGSSDPKERSLKKIFAKQIAFSAQHRKRTERPIQFYFAIVETLGGTKEIRRFSAKNESLHEEFELVKEPDLFRLEPILRERRV